MNLEENGMKNEMKSLTYALLGFIAGTLLLYILNVLSYGGFVIMEMIACMIIFTIFYTIQKIKRQEKKEKLNEKS